MRSALGANDRRAGFVRNVRHVQSVIEMRVRYQNEIGPLNMRVKGRMPFGVDARVQHLRSLTCRFQPRRLRIVPAVGGCKPVLGGASVGLIQKAPQGGWDRTEPVR